jgi:hypothetical protein
MKLKTSLLFGQLFLTGSILAGVCPQMGEHPDLSNGEIEDFIKENRIVLVNKVDREHILNFHHELQKFPEALMKEMLTMQADIHILQGTGVSEDPTWDKQDVQSGSGGRGWDIVPGSGGYPYYKMAVQKSGVTDLKSIPTRIVVNQLYNKSNPIGGHGSENLFLHEHGHSLDSLYAAHDVSSSSTFQNIFSKENVSYLRSICPTHCFNGDEINFVEAFAESFTHYSACDLSRQKMEVDAPKIAEFFAGLTTVKEFKIKENRRQGLELIPRVSTSGNGPSEKIPGRSEGSTPRKKKRLGRFLKDLIDDIFD